MKIETDDGTVALYHEPEYTMAGWSKAIQPEVCEPGETPSEDTLWLNTYIEFYS